MNSRNPDNLVDPSQKNEQYLQAINVFATALFEAQSINDIVWTVTQNAMDKLGYHDCIIYLYDSEKDKLVQKAAYGPKNPDKKEIIDPIEITPGKGIVGYVFKSGKGEIIDDTSKDPRYILDDELRFSEIAVPIFSDGQAIGVIDSEHPDKYFFKQLDFEIMTTIAAMVSTKIAQANARRELLNYQENLEELVQNKTAELAAKNEQLEKQNTEKELLIREVHHRVKNNMQIMISLVSLQMAATTSEEEKQTLQEFGSRIRSMAIIHEHLYAKKDISNISIKQYIQELIDSILSSTEGPKQVEVNLDIDPIDIDLDTSIPLGLILNELTTNSIKHAFSKQNNPQIDICLKDKGGHIEFCFKDNGVGFDLNDPPQGSFGMDLVHILANQIGSELIHDIQRGYHCSFIIKL